MKALQRVLEDVCGKYDTTRDIGILQETVAMGLPPDSSEEGRAQNVATYEAGKPLWDDVAECANNICEQLGATAKMTIIDYLVNCADVFLQPCSPSLEYPRSDLPKNVRFMGAYPPKKIESETTELPEWWDELLAAKKEGKKVVFVTQGTFQLDFNMLLKPTFKALADREDVFIIGVLGQRDATLDGVKLPANTRVVDYLLYDAVLLYADVFVSNAGYGGFLYSVMHGVPMVLAGCGQDRAKVCMRGEYAGIALNLKTDSPSVEALRDGIRFSETSASKRGASKFSTRMGSLTIWPSWSERFWSLHGLEDEDTKIMFALHSFNTSTAFV